MNLNPRLMSSERPRAQRLKDAFDGFVRSELFSPILLVVATVLARSRTPYGSAYVSFNAALELQPFQFRGAADTSKGRIYSQGGVRELISISLPSMPMRGVAVSVQVQMSIYMHLSSLA